MTEFYQTYADNLSRLLREYQWDNVHRLAEDLRRIWADNRQVFLCGNGGSAANAVHWANDLVFGISPGRGDGIKAHALSANTSVMTCLANDLSYNDIFSYQLSVMGNAGDMLIGLSGSGNSPNIIQAVQTAKRMEIKTYAILGYSGGKVLELVDVPIHFPLDDMQISEDCQQIVCHMVMRWLKENPVPEQKDKI